MFMNKHSHNTNYLVDEHKVESHREYKDTQHIFTKTDTHTPGII